MPELTIDVKNNVNLAKIQEILKKTNVEVLVGYPSGRPHIEAKHEPQPDGTYKGGSAVGMETADLAKKLYYGDGEIPARPFLTDAIRENAEQIRSVVEEQAKRVVDGLNPNWRQVGTEAVRVVQEFVRGDYYENNIPNSASTVQRKGSSKPLIDSADLINSTTFKIVGDK